jgi:hypothetical protein
LAFLDLGNCSLAEVPQKIGEQVWLEELSFAEEWSISTVKNGLHLIAGL